jgi:hypothetical protein
MAIDLKYGHVTIPGIPDDEPVFILRAQDKFAEETVRYYGSAAAGHGQPMKWAKRVDAARDAIAAWPKKKIPD